MSFNFDKGKLTTAYDKIQGFQYTTFEQWLHDLFLNGNFVSRINTGLTPIVQFVPPKNKTFWFLAARVVNTTNASHQVSLQNDGVEVDRIIAGRDSTNSFKLPVDTLVGDGTKAYSLQNLTGVGDLFGIIIGYLEDTVKQEFTRP